MRLLCFFFFFLLFSCLVKAAAVDTLSTATCGNDMYPTKLESDACQKLQSSENFNSLSEDEKKRIIVNMISKGDSTVDRMHALVHSFNSKLNFTIDDPQGIEMTKIVYTPSGSTTSTITKHANDYPIQNIWAATFSAYPIYEDKNISYTEGEGKVLAGYHYKIYHVPPEIRVGWDKSGNGGCIERLPPNSHNPYGPAGGGNCKTDYVTVQDRSKFKVYLNGQLLNSGDTKAHEFGVRKVYDFAMSAQNYKFTSELDAFYYIKTREWNWVNEGCCREVSCGEDCEECVAWEWDCEERENEDGGNTWEYKYYHTTVKHEYPKTIKPYIKPTYSTQITITDRETSPIVQLDTDAPDYVLNMGETSLSQFKTGYRIDWIYPPYNALNVVKINGSDTKLIAKGKLIDNDKGLTLFSTEPENTDTCSITYFYPLGEKETQQCPEYIEKHSPALNIQTNKWNFEKDDTVSVDVQLAWPDTGNSGDVEVSYCGETQTAHVTGGSAAVEFPAVQDCSEISAFLLDPEYPITDSAMVNVKKNHGLIFSLIIFFGLLILTARFAWSRYWRRVI